ncbi:MAG TPA: hypothetical protein DD723_06790 [Candidatus Omnitrophica bacterium]|nr:MAG: hypothetical protein A2Z81_07300 [Omnitrophica WOR_2 bacterium GWA2_45_18]HBR15231.1 hypothetical protein [Candidatus Omnitrophota bacterium]
MKNSHPHFVILLLTIAYLTVPRPLDATPAPENGSQTDNYPNGNPRLETRYKNGRIIRKKTFYKNGNVFMDCTYKNKRLTSKKTFYETGRLQSRWNSKSGITQFYDENGNLETELKE